MKVIKILFSMIIAIMLMNGEKINAYDFAENTPYIIMDVQTLGTIKVYVPKDKIEYLQVTKERDNVVNISSGTIYGYCHVDNTEYRINFNTFTQNTYRQNSNGYTAFDLKINMIIDTNISHLKEISDITFEEMINENENIKTYIIIFIALGVCLLWLKH